MANSGHSWAADITDANDLYTHFLVENGPSVLVSAPEPADSQSLFVIDMQNDFTLPAPAGRFSVYHGIKMAEKLSSFIEKNHSKFTKIIFSRDTHPFDHCSFAGSGGPFPAHCVINSKGAAMHESMLKFSNISTSECCWHKLVV